MRWRECVAYMASEGVMKFVECGAGKVLTGLLKRIAPEASGVAVGDPADFEAYRHFVTNDDNKKARPKGRALMRTTVRSINISRQPARG